MLINGDHYTGKTKMQRCKGYVEALEEERRKICVLRRELPLCVELVTQAIEACKKQLPGTTTECFHGQLECSEQKSSEGPSLEQIIPVKRISSISDDDDDEQQSQEIKYNNITDNKDTTNNVRFPNNKSDMLRLVPLWKQKPDPTIKEDYPRRISVREVKRDGIGGAFYLFNREKVWEMEVAKESLQRSSSSSAVPATPGSSTTGTSGSSRGSYDCGSKKEEKGQASQTKERRCWSSELHRRFLYALQQLGGSHVATPKQIKEIMTFDGLTNDEVKSHLQKYRLHERRQSPLIQESHHPKAVVPQSIVVGGIWMPRPDYAAMATTAESGEVVSGIALSNGVYYVPIATMPGSLPEPEPESEPSPVSLNQSQQHQRLNSDDTDGHIEGGFRSDPPAASYSTHSTKASPVF